MLHVNPDLSDRHARILDAAEHCFVRTGFHRTTMQHVALEAGMSAGNLYRYFPSKDAIVAGLTERDRREVAESFAALPTSGADFMAAFCELGRRHFEDEPREKAVLCLEILSEATRNPDIAKLSAEFASEMVERLAALLEAARTAGTITPALDSHTIATLICTMADGMFVRRAVLASFDPSREVAAVMHVIGALVCGQVPALPPSSEEEVLP